MNLQIILPNVKKLPRASPILSPFCAFLEASLSQEHSSCYSSFTLADFPLLPSLRKPFTAPLRHTCLCTQLAKDVFLDPTSAGQRDNTALVSSVDYSQLVVHS